MFGSFPPLRLPDQLDEDGVSRTVRVLIFFFAYDFIRSFSSFFCLYF